MNTKLVTVLALVAAASAARPNYNFRWAVRDENSRNDFGHQESRNLENTEGAYFVQLPDGRLQQVSYRVDGGSGYLAEVSYKGDARFPDSDESFESRGRRVFSAPRSRSSGGPSTSSFSRGSFESLEFPFASRESREDRFDSRESREFPFASRESREHRFDSRESHEFPFASRESHEFFAAPKNPFIRADSNEYRYA